MPHHSKTTLPHPKVGDTIMAIPHKCGDNHGMHAHMRTNCHNQFSNTRCVCHTQTPNAANLHERHCILWWPGTFGNPHTCQMQAAKTVNNRCINCTQVKPPRQRDCLMAETHSTTTSTRRWTPAASRQDPGNSRQPAKNK